MAEGVDVEDEEEDDAEGLGEEEEAVGVLEEEDEE